MRRLPILLALALVFVLLVFAPVSAEKKWDCKDRPDHPICDTTPTDTTTTLPPTAVECVFDGGVLQDWDGSEGLRCQWTVTAEERKKAFSFTLVPVSPEIGKTVNLPHLIVTDVYPSGGGICFNEHDVGWSDLEYSWTSFMLPAEGDCPGDWRTVDHVDDVFAITISVNRVRNGDVKLEYTQPQAESS
jgi:hypothetical protein